MADPFIIARTGKGKDVLFHPARANRHGLITGATGTGKTVTLQVLAERFSRIGVPIFLADVKGDLTGLALAGTATPTLRERLKATGAPEPEWHSNPVVFWDVFGRRGLPVRATISDLGPLLLGRLFGLNETQHGVLSIAFRSADDAGLLLLDLKDLRAMLQFVGDHAREFQTQYGHVSSASVGAIQRALLQLEDQGGDRFFGEPMLDVDDLMQTDANGRGMINILAADDLIQYPKVYSAFLLWILSELFERLPEVGDADKPRLVFFFDEAHLLFADAPGALVEKIEQVVRLIRSKGVGVYFVTHNPSDLPEVVLAQLSNRIQHALRAFTPHDQKAVRAAAATLRPNPPLDAERAISELAIGEALISVLDETGTPTPTERAWMLAPGSQIGPIADPQREAIHKSSSELYGQYERPVDRESAYEQLSARAAAKTDSAAGSRTGAPLPGQGGGRPPISGPLSDILFGSTGPRGGRREGMIEAAAKSAARSIGSSIGRAILRGTLGGIRSRR
jgi:DNA double-strand break repair helicase HerA and related ATPase